MTTVNLTSDITYAEADGTRLQIDLYPPDIEGPVPQSSTCTVVAERGDEDRRPWRTGLLMLHRLIDQH